MPVIVFDDFTRPDNPTSLGTATTGQVWELVPGESHILPGDPFGISSNQAFWNRNGTGETGDSYVVVDAGNSNTRGQVKIMDVTAGGGLNLRNQGLVLRYVDATHYIFCAYFNASGTTGFRVYIADGGNPIARGFGAFFTMVNGDTMGYACCDQTIQFYHNDVLMCEGFVGAPLSATLLAGTKFGLMASGGIISSPPFQTFDDFQVETNSECEGANWIIPALTWTAEGIVESDTPTGGVRTLRFDAGSGSQYYYVAPVTDSSNELTTKTIKSVRATGRLTNAAAKVYRYDVAEGINLDDLEDGTNSTTGAIPITDSTLVAQSAQLNTNVTNCALSTVRIEGDDREQDVRDELHEVVLQVADAGVRR